MVPTLAAVAQFPSNRVCCRITRLHGTLNEVDVALSFLDWQPGVHSTWGFISTTMVPPTSTEFSMKVLLLLLFTKSSVVRETCSTLHR